MTKISFVDFKEKKVPKQAVKDESEETRREIQLIWDRKDIITEQELIGFLKEMLKKIGQNAYLSQQASYSKTEYKIIKRNDKLGICIRNKTSIGYKSWRRIIGGHISASTLADKELQEKEQKYLTKYNIKTKRTYPEKKILCSQDEFSSSEDEDSTESLHRTPSKIKQTVSKKRPLTPELELSESNQQKKEGIRKKLIRSRRASKENYLRFDDLEFILPLQDSKWIKINIYENKDLNHDITPSQICENVKIFINKVKELAQHQNDNLTLYRFNHIVKCDTFLEKNTQSCYLECSEALSPTAWRGIINSFEQYVSESRRQPVFLFPRSNEDSMDQPSGSTNIKEEQNEEINDLMQDPNYELYLNPEMVIPLSTRHDPNINDNGLSAQTYANITQTFNSSSSQSARHNNNNLSKPAFNIGNDPVISNLAASLNKKFGKQTSQSNNNLINDTDPSIFTKKK